MIVFSNEKAPRHNGQCAVRTSLGDKKGGVGGTVASESVLRSAGTLMSRVRAPPLAPWPDRGPESPRSRRCGLAVYKN
ncbi:hypothetical protein PoB_005893100 [Plakobranchus ocellatus]|uniref:Uncharacterized protein n=1 Tax=Plakobranchus ocellatus TaxID=259542 RepID=A0AAV4CAV2_9GAST|nr:hypothetical protein PoB_005893100 [Plakobranchus ocellatus]